MAEQLIQVNDLQQRAAAVALDLIHLKASDDNGDYKITVSDLAASLTSELSLGNLAFLDTVNNNVWLGTDLSITNGGTGSSSASGARVNLDVYSKGEADGRYLLKANNLSGLANVGTARTNLGLGTFAILNQVDRTITAGNGLTGGGNLASNVTLSLGTPLSISRVTGNTTTPTGHTHSLDSSLLVPVGGVIMWSGSIASIPTGWALCNGSNGTPDLRDKFIVGASQDSVGVARTNVTGSLTITGGSKDAVVVAHTHSASVIDPGHNHSIPNNRQLSTYGGTEHLADFNGSERTDSVTLNSATTGISVGINNAGTSGTNKNLPPYYALAFIMKV